jgi:hypothetical protein
MACWLEHVVVVPLANRVPKTWTCWFGARFTSAVNISFGYKTGLAFGISGTKIFSVFPDHSWAGVPWDTTQKLVSDLGRERNSQKSGVSPNIR